MWSTSRATVKLKLIQTEIHDVKLHKPKRVNEAECVTDYQEHTRCSNSTGEEVDVDIDMDMRLLYNAASVLRNAVSESLTDITDEHIPKGLCSFWG